VQKLYGGKSTLVRGTQRKQVTFAFGAEFVEVRTNSRTREICVPRLVGAFAARRIMNTRTARSQLMGRLIWGNEAAYPARGLGPPHGNHCGHGVGPG
jgi:xanthine dehydrogenase YagR molybdenum-binding subunit